MCVIIVCTVAASHAHPGQLACYAASLPVWIPTRCASGWDGARPFDLNVLVGRAVTLAAHPVVIERIRNWIDAMRAKYRRRSRRSMTVLRLAYGK